MDCEYNVYNSTYACCVVIVLGDFPVDSTAVGHIPPLDGTELNHSQASSQLHYCNKSVTMTMTDNMYLHHTGVSGLSYTKYLRTQIQFMAKSVHAGNVSTPRKFLYHIFSILYPPIYIKKYFPTLSKQIWNTLDLLLKVSECSLIL